MKKWTHGDYHIVFNLITIFFLPKEEDVSISINRPYQTTGILSSWHKLIQVELKIG
jgi:hypothetical protein